MTDCIYRPDISCFETFDQCDECKSCEFWFDWVEAVKEWWNTNV